jgi:predicted DNA-binding protein (MmcQ/YjbR family)
MFALTPLNASGFQVNLKCNPERAIELRDRFPAIGPGYHMNKVHWNTLYIDGSIPNTLFKELIDHSYQLILDSLPAAIRKTITE